MEQQMDNSMEDNMENNIENNPEQETAEEQVQASNAEQPDCEAKSEQTEESEAAAFSEENSAKDSDSEETDDSSEDAQSDKENSEAEEGTAKSGEKKGFFKKNKKKDKKDEKIEELTDQVKRQMAEFDNFRKRTDKEKTQMYEIGAKSIIEKVLPVVDNFERGLAAVPEESKDDAFVDGMNKIYKQLMTMLEEADVKPIEAVGKEFDPNLHNAVMQTESEEYESGIVAQELQKGYTYRDSVVRHSMVAVVS